METLSEMFKRIIDNYEFITDKHIADYYNNVEERNEESLADKIQSVIDNLNNLREKGK